MAEVKTCTGCRHLTSPLHVAAVPESAPVVRGAPESTEARAGDPGVMGKLSSGWVGSQSPTFSFSPYN